MEHRLPMEGQEEPHQPPAQEGGVEAHPSQVEASNASPSLLWVMVGWALTVASIAGLGMVSLLMAEASHLKQDELFLALFLLVLLGLGGLLGWRVRRGDTWAQWLFLALLLPCLYAGVLGWWEELDGGRSGILALLGAVLLGLIALWVGLWVTRTKHRPRGNKPVRD